MKIAFPISACVVMLAMVSACTTKVVVVAPSQTPATTTATPPANGVASPGAESATVEPTSILTRAAPTTATQPASQPKSLWTLCRKTGTSSDVLSGDLPYPFVNNANYEYRCYQGKVLECATGATGGACMKLYSGTDQPAGLAAFCAQNPDQYPPNALQAVQGDGPNAYLWRCSGTTPLMYVNPDYDAADFDEVGFVKSAWQDVPNPSQP